MKVKFKYGIKTYSGTIDEMVYGSFRDDHLCIGREYVYPTLNANNTHIGACMKNLASVYKNAASGYKADLKTYSGRNGNENVHKDQLVPNGFSCFIQMMFAWAKTDPLHIDLTAVTVADIVTMDADVKTIERAIDAGYLAHISVYDDLTTDIQ
jgi:hypothetical protein